AERHPRSLSAGRRQRVAIAAVAVGGAEVLLLDEPTRGIDPPSAAALEAALSAHAGAGGGAVLATPTVELAAPSPTRAVVLGEGDVVASGPAREVLAGSLFAPQVLRVLPPYLRVAEVGGALEPAWGGPAARRAGCSTCFSCSSGWARSCTRSGSRRRRRSARPTPPTPRSGPPPAGRRRCRAWPSRSAGGR